MKRTGRSTVCLFLALAAAGVCLFPAVAIRSSAADSLRRELEKLDPPFRESVLRGWRYFNTSYSEDGVACAHCHRDHSDMIPWAGSYPKVQVFDNTPYRVKSLRTVIIEAMTRHTDLGPLECSEMAEDLLAYISWWGDGQPLKPGVRVSGPPPDEDLAELEEAVRRGMLLFNREKPVSCVQCHIASGPSEEYRTSLEGVYTGFPRTPDQGERARSFDLFLLDHYRRHGVVMGQRNITDIAAYLARLSGGRLLRPGTAGAGEGGEHP